MQVTIMCTDDVPHFSDIISQLSERIQLEYMSRHDITSMSVSEIIERVNPKEYKNYISSEFASNSVSHMEKEVDGLDTKILELESKKQRHEKTMEKLMPGSSGISSLKPMAYYKHIKMSSIMSIEDAIRKITRAYNELDKISKSRESLIRQRGKVNLQLEMLKKEFHATAKYMEITVKKYNLRKYMTSLVDTIQSPDTDINDKEKVQTELDRLMKKFKLSDISEVPDVVSSYVSPSPTTLILTKSDNDYRKHKPYTYLAKTGRKYYTICVIKINKLVPQIARLENAIEIMLDQSNEILEKSSRLNKDIDSNEDIMKEIARGTPLERANIDRSTTLSTLKKYRKEYIHAEDVIDTYDLTTKQQTSLNRARRLRDNKLDQIEELNHQIKKIQYKIKEYEESIDFSFVESAARFANDVFSKTFVDILSDMDKKTMHRILDNHSLWKAMFALKCSSGNNIMVDGLLPNMDKRLTIHPPNAINMVDTIHLHESSKSIYLISSNRYADSLTEWSTQSKAPLNAEIVKFGKDTTIQDFLLIMR